MIWVISTDSESRQIIGLNLSKRGFGVLVTSSINELGPKCAEPQLIILDVNPPEECGWEITRELRQRFGVKETPIILLMSEVPTNQQLAPFQPIQWLEKPLDIDTLLTLVRKFEEAPEYSDGSITE